MFITRINITLNWILSNPPINYLLQFVSFDLVLWFGLLDYEILVCVNIMNLVHTSWSGEFCWISSLIVPLVIHIFCFLGFFVWSIKLLRLRYLFSIIELMEINVLKDGKRQGRWGWWLALRNGINHCYFSRKHGVCE